MQYAGFWWRVLATLIDTVLLMIVAFIAGLILAFGGAAADPGSPGPNLAGNLLGLVIGWLYYTLFESSEKMATPGKFLLGLTVTDEQGQRISFGKANARYWSKILSGLILCIGYIMVAFTEKKQGLHDIIAKTLVVKKASVPTVTM